MRIVVNGVQLYFDVEGAGLVPDGPRMQAKPTLLMIHGGPGIDHSFYKPYFSRFADVAQVVYLDNRGDGRSDRAPAERWNIAQWAEDIHAFCLALGIERPLVYGASFGGTLAMAYAARYPSHPRALMLVSTEAEPSDIPTKIALFERHGGPEVGALARKRYLEGNTDRETLEAWIRLAVPLYTRATANPDVITRMQRNPETTQWFTRVGGEQRTFNLLPDLARIQCPVLLLGGVDDPMTPIESQRKIAAALPGHLLSYHEFENCRHGVVADVPEEAEAILRAFIAKHRA
jgi:pimeloyl-ACP methyl ester carboxylesterase